MKKNLFPVLMVLALGACQPDTPTQQPKLSPAVTAPVVAAPPPAAAVAEVKAAPVSEDAAMRALAQKSLCFTCHTIDNNLVGPAWSKVAAKYRGQKDAEAKLVAKVAKGGGGVWGNVAMPPNSPKVSEKDIQTLVGYILLLK
ncbi:MAG: c-type cytochrome [Sideroxydans sp.]|nr:c-type cytochrome [Sideroxydans sp.]